MNRIACIVVAAIVVAVAADFSAAPRTFTLTVQRNMTCKDGSTNGRLLVGGNEIARTLEPALPGNRIPAGSYQGVIRTDGDLGWRVELKDVKGWEAVQIHKGNYPSNTKGCILVGTGITGATDPKTGQETCMVTNSADALAKIQAAMQKASDSGVSSQGLAITITVE